MKAQRTNGGVTKKERQEEAKVFHQQKPFVLESGDSLAELRIGYQCWGTLNDRGDNAIWICHALTASADAKDWWPNLVGEGLAFDTGRYFVVCANILGSCYGTTGPNSINPDTGEPYFHSFPAITIRDIVGAHEVLRNHLGISFIHLLVGGSMGGYQALEWAVMNPALIKNLFVLTTSARETAWGIAIHTAQRMAIETDSTWTEGKTTDGKEGLKVARAIGMLTYRGYESFIKTQTDTDTGKTDGYLASSYIKYQGEKLANRFSAHSYWLLTKALDSHNLARGRGHLPEVLSTIRANTLIMGITSDLLCPIQELQFLAQHIPEAVFVKIDSLYGHDGFLVETGAITHHLTNWLP